MGSGSEVLIRNELRPVDSLYSAKASGVKTVYPARASVCDGPGLRSVQQDGNHGRVVDPELRTSAHMPLSPEGAVERLQGGGREPATAVDLRPGVAGVGDRRRCRRCRR